MFQYALIQGLALYALGQHSDSVAEMQALVDAHPDLLSAREALGQLALLVEDYKLGIENLEIALQSNPPASRANLLFDLGVAYFICGDLESARTCFKRGTRLAVDFKSSWPGAHVPSHTNTHTRKFS